jgi:hypothetical protein
VVVSGTSSYDSESSLVQYRWVLGTDAFTGTTLDPQKWVYSSTGVTRSNQIDITGIVFGIQHPQGACAAAGLDLKTRDGCFD